MKQTPDPTDLRERALRLLARREHSRFELARKLEHAGFHRGDVFVLLDEFEKRNWLSDRRFAESYVTDHSAKTGSVKLAYDLSRRGVSDAVIESVLSEDRDSEFERAREVWRKKFGTHPANPHEEAKQMRFLQGRGFSQNTIRRALKEDASPD